MLGAEGTRRYFIAFTTPAEARGLGGFMGNWAVLTARDGRLRLAEFGRTQGPQPWRNASALGHRAVRLARRCGGSTVSPTGPGAARARRRGRTSRSRRSCRRRLVVAQELLPQSGSTPVDGVFAMDPQVLQALLSMTGPISVEGSDVRLDASNVLPFLLIDQYAIEDNSERVDFLEDVSRATLDQVLGGALPDPTVVARELGPLVARGAPRWAGRPTRRNRHCSSRSAWRNRCRPWRVATESQRCSTTRAPTRSTCTSNAT